MDKKDKEVLKGSALATADAIVAAIHPGVALAWALGKSLFGAGMKLREDRALQFVEHIKVHPDIFIGKILETTEFQDAFVFTLENYLRERSEKKRLFIKGIFTGFAESPDMSLFPLERYLHILAQLDQGDVEVLKIFVDGSVVKWYHEFYKNTHIQPNSNPIVNITQVAMVLRSVRNDSKFDDTEHLFEVLVRLSNLGLIYAEINNHMKKASGLFSRAAFGEKFFRYLLR